MKNNLKNKMLLVLLIAVSYFNVAAQTESETAKVYAKKILKGEYWWGGLSVDGFLMPYKADDTFTRNLFGNNGGNQAQPLLISNKGRYVWSEKPFKYTIKSGMITVISDYNALVSGREGTTFNTAFKYVSKTYFPSNGKIPAPLMFEKPQYNTWIELMYDQNEADILKYAQGIIDNGFPPGVLMIDDTWQEDYGKWEFSARNFKNPKAMVDKLHEMGFKVMLWICPFVSADSVEFRYLAENGMLLLDEQKTQNILWANTQNKAAVVRWWNGASGLLDLSNNKTKEWFTAKMDYLVEEYGIDGFKLDAGDADFYLNNVVSFKPSLPNDHTTYFAEVGLKYPFNEYRASWKMAGLPLAQRLRDKSHSWKDLQSLVPGIIAQGLMGYAYTCPDLIGGGSYASFLEGAIIDEELIVRAAQVHALMPMMQFSVAPWRVLNKENLEICRKMAVLHEKFGEQIVALAKESSITGAPMARPLFFNYPNKDYELIDDQFMLGKDIVVAPVVNKGERRRKVILPPGTWKSDAGKIYKGGKEIDIAVPLARLPYFERVK